jgi:hypothetical protein
MSRHFLIPDTQVRPGVPLDHFEWIGQAIVDYMPDKIIHLGDHWDMPSLSAHDAPGSKATEGARYENDVEVGNRAFETLCKPMEAEQARLKKQRKIPWKPRKVFLTGNHCNRITRAINANPKYDGAISLSHLDTRDFERHDFLERVWLDGILYSHYFQSSHSHHAIGGSIDSMLNKIGASFVQGHRQSLQYGTRNQGSGAAWHGLVAGSCYTHIENYRSAQGQRHWRGVVVLNEVENGEYCIMPLTLNYLCKKYTGKSLIDYMNKKYPKGDWRHLA